MTVSNQPQPVASPSPSTASKQSDTTALQLDCNRLREQVRKLEQQHDNDQQKIAELEQDRRSLYALVQGMFSDEQLRFTKKEVQELLEGRDGLPLDGFLGELEQRALGK
jgi:hypothetical protein